MTWICPECKARNSDISANCDCGFIPQKFFCTACKCEIQVSDKKCPQCNVVFVDQCETETPKDKDKQIREVLKQFDEFLDGFCLECGYKGAMGIIKEKIPWYFTWWVLVPVMLTGIGTIPAICLILCRLLFAKHTIECPECREILITK